MHLYHMTDSANQNSSCNPACTHEAEHMAGIKIPTVILFCKHTVLYLVHSMHTKCRLVVKGHSAPFCIFLLPRKPILGISDSIHVCLHS